MRSSDIALLNPHAELWAKVYRKRYKFVIYCIVRHIIIIIILSSTFCDSKNKMHKEMRTMCTDSPASISVSLQTIAVIIYYASTKRLFMCQWCGVREPQIARIDSSFIHCRLDTNDELYLTHSEMRWLLPGWISCVRDAHGSSCSLNSMFQFLYRFQCWWCWIKL